MPTLGINFFIIELPFNNTAQTEVTLYASQGTDPSMWFLESLAWECSEEFVLIAPHAWRCWNVETCLPTSGSSQILGKTSSFEAMSFAFEPSRKWNQFASQIAAAISGACKVLQIAQL